MGRIPPWANDANVRSAVRQAILDEVDEERERQDAKHGAPDQIAPVRLSILMEEVGEVSREINDWWGMFDQAATDDGWISADARERYRTELIQVAAVAVATVEALDA